MGRIVISAPVVKQMDTKRRFTRIVQRVLVQIVEIVEIVDDVYFDRMTY